MIANKMAQSDLGRLECKMVLMDQRISLIEKFIESRFCETFRDFSIRAYMSGSGPGNNSDNNGFYSGHGGNVSFRDYGSRTNEDGNFSTSRDKRGGGHTDSVNHSSNVNGSCTINNHKDGLRNNNGQVVDAESESNKEQPAIRNDLTCEDQTCENSANDAPIINNPNPPPINISQNSDSNGLCSEQVESSSIQDIASRTNEETDLSTNHECLGGGYTDSVDQSGKGDVNGSECSDTLNNPNDSLLNNNDQVVSAEGESNKEEPAIRKDQTSQSESSANDASKLIPNPVSVTNSQNSASGSPADVIVIISSDEEVDSNLQKTKKINHPSPAKQYRKRKHPSNSDNKNSIGKEHSKIKVCVANPGLGISRAQLVTKKQFADGNYAFSLHSGNSLRLITFPSNRAELPQTLRLVTQKKDANNASISSNHQLQFDGNETSIGSDDKSSAGAFHKARSNLNEKSPLEILIDEDSDNPVRRRRRVSRSALCPEVLLVENGNTVELENTNAEMIGSSKIQQRSEKIHSRDQACSTSDLKNGRLSRLKETEKSALHVSASAEERPPKPSEVLRSVPNRRKSTVNEEIEITETVLAQNKAPVIPDEYEETEQDSNSPEPPPLINEENTSMLETQKLTDSETFKEFVDEDNIGEHVMPVLLPSTAPMQVDINQDYEEGESDAITSPSLEPQESMIALSNETEDQVVNSDGASNPLTESVQVVVEPGCSRNILREALNGSLCLEPVQNETRQQLEDFFQTSTVEGNIPSLSDSFDRKCRKRVVYCELCELGCDSMSELQRHLAYTHCESDAEDESASMDESDEGGKRKKRQQKKSIRSQHSSLKKNLGDSETETEDFDTVTDSKKETAYKTNYCKQLVICPYCESAVSRNHRFSHLRNSKVCTIKPEQLKFEESNRNKGRISWKPAPPIGTSKIILQRHQQPDESNAGYKVREIVMGEKQSLTASSADSDDEPAVRTKLKSRAINVTSTNVNRKKENRSILKPFVDWRRGETSDSDEGPMPKRRKDQHPTATTTTSMTSDLNNDVTVMPTMYHNSRGGPVSVIEHNQEEGMEICLGQPMNNRCEKKFDEGLDPPDQVVDQQVQENLNNSAVDTEIISGDEITLFGNDHTDDENGRNNFGNADPHTFGTTGIVECPTCRKSMKLTSLRRHQEKVCLKPKEKVCLKPKEKMCLKPTEKVCLNPKPQSKNMVGRPSKDMIAQMVCKYEDCGYEPKSRKDYDIHNEIHPPNQGKPCAVCKKVFIEELNLQDHMKTHQMYIPYDATLVSIKNSKRLQPKVVVAKLPPEEKSTLEV